MLVNLIPIYIYIVSIITISSIPLLQHCVWFLLFRFFLFIVFRTKDSSWCYLSMYTFKVVFCFELLCFDHNITLYHKVSKANLTS